MVPATAIRTTTMTIAPITAGLEALFELTAIGDDELDGEVVVPVDGELVGELVGELPPV
jgi:hypothetical protein